MKSSGCQFHPGKGRIKKSRDLVNVSGALPRFHRRRRPDTQRPDHVRSSFRVRSAHGARPLSRSVLRFFVCSRPVSCTPKLPQTFVAASNQFPWAADEAVSPAPVECGVGEAVGLLSALGTVAAAVMWLCQHNGLRLADVQQQTLA